MNIMLPTFVIAEILKRERAKKNQREQPRVEVVIEPPTTEPDDNERGVCEDVLDA